MSASINHLPAKRVKLTLPRPGVAEAGWMYGTCPKTYGACLKTKPARSPFASGHSVRHGHLKPRSPMGCAFKTYERGAKLMTASIKSGLESGAQSERILTRPLRVSYVPLMCALGRRASAGPPRPAATLNRTLHSNPGHFIVHSSEIRLHPSAFILHH